MPADTYQLIDSGGGRKLERFGEVTVDRPCAQAVWRPRVPRREWDADLRFSRESGASWEFARPAPSPWEVCIAGLRFRLTPTDFGHVGVFPEHRRAWDWMGRQAFGDPAPRVLNLFAYSGGATLAAAQLGWSVCHLDASKKMVRWARENADLNGLSEAPIRWIVDDVTKFLKREARRGRQYEGIVLDPPSYGRGKRQELFKIDDHLPDLLALCRQVLSERPRFVFLSCHTPGYTPLVLQHLLSQTLAGDSGGEIDSGEMVLGDGRGVLPVPSGTYAVWRAR